MVSVDFSYLRPHHDRPFSKSSDGIETNSRGVMYISRSIETCFCCNPRKTLRNSYLHNYFPSISLKNKPNKQNLEFALNAQKHMENDRQNHIKVVPTIESKPKNEEKVIQATNIWHLLTKRNQKPQIPKILTSPQNKTKKTLKKNMFKKHNAFSKAQQRQPAKRSNKNIPRRLLRGLRASR